MNQNPPIDRVNARPTDAFDIFNCRHSIGPNPDLPSAAFTFDFSRTGYHEPLPLPEYVARVGDRYPHLTEATYESYAQLFGRTVAAVNKLEMDLYCDRWTMSSYQDGPRDITRIAVECLHARTCRAVVYCVWDWFEAITQGQSFQLDAQIGALQRMFRQSAYGGPTVYALWRTAHEKGIPVFHLWDEGLVQYGYGKQQVRGIATTFDGDSHLDSDFTTRKDDCKAFLGTLGFPVPKGEVVLSWREALNIAEKIGYPVAVKPVVGHKGIGVTADVQDAGELETAYDRAVQAIPEDQSVRIIVETSITGKDFRLLCVNGRFVAATERRPATVIGDGYSTLGALIERENRLPARIDTPTSPLGKIVVDEAMERYLEQQELSIDSVIERDRAVALRKVANLSSGGYSIDATRNIHPDNVVLAQDIAQHFRLTCLGIDVIARDLAKSWKESSFGIIEINAAPGIFMHLKPAVGESVDVTSAILETFFESADSARIPIVTFNRISVPELQETIDHILLKQPHWTVGAVCREGVFVNRAEKAMNFDYNTNVLNLLRHPKLDLLIAEYPGDILDVEGMFYYGSNVVILENPSAAEMMLKRDVFHHSTVVVKQNETVSIQREGLIEQYELSPDEPFTRVFLKEISAIV